MPGPALPRPTSEPLPNPLGLLGGEVVRCPTAAPRKGAGDQGQGRDRGRGSRLLTEADILPTCPEVKPSVS